MSKNSKKNKFAKAIIILVVISMIIPLVAAVLSYI